MRTINPKFTALLAATGADNYVSQTPSATFGLPEPMSFDDVYLDSTCLKAEMDFPTERVLLRDTASDIQRTKMLVS